MIRRPPRSTQSRSSAASDVYKRQSPYSEDPMMPAATATVDAGLQAGRGGPVERGSVDACVSVNTGSPLGAGGAGAPAAFGQRAVGSGTTATGQVAWSTSQTETAPNMKCCARLP